MKWMFCMAITILVAMILLPVIVVKSTGMFGLPMSRSAGESVPIRVYLHKQDKTVEMGLEQYLVGVVAAEMPAGFHPEALKAQAVAARTYAVKHMKHFGGSGLKSHPDADISTDHRECQAWIGEQEMRERWGKNYDLYQKKIVDAVQGTRGLVITYQGKYIDALFHSTSGDYTASAVEVWGTEVPYLKSVACNYDAQSPRYSEDKLVTMAELEQKLGQDALVVPASQTGEPAELVAVLNKTPSGRVSAIRVGSLTFDGVTLREKLGLKSARITYYSLQEDKVIFHTQGYGHGVGLCQYGANGMAKEGKEFRTILKHYYTGISIEGIV